MLDFQEIVNKNIIIHCETKEEAIILLNDAHKFGLKWSSGIPFIEDYNWDFYKEKTCYELLEEDEIFGSGFTGIDYFLDQEDKKIIKFKDLIKPDEISLDNYLDEFNFLESHDIDLV